MRNLPLIAAALATLGCSRQEAPTPPVANVPETTAPAEAVHPPRHHADLAPTQGNQAAGTVELIPMDGVVLFTGTITGLKPNSEHGFHIHEKGDCSAADAASAGGHFNPTAQAHGNPASPPHHAGDIPNLVADAQGNAQVNARLEEVTVGGGPNDLLGKALVLHAKVDDYKSQPAGNSGGRIACGVIQ